MMLSKRNLVFQIAFFWWTMLNFGMVNFNFLMDPYFLWICVFPSEKLCGFLSVFTSWTFSRSYKMGPYYHGYIMGPAPIAMAENKLVFHWSFFHKWSDMGIYWNNLVTLCPSYTLGIPWGFRACKALGTFGHPELPGALRFGEWKKKNIRNSDHSNIASEQFASVLCWLNFFPTAFFLSHAFYFQWLNSTLPAETAAQPPLRAVKSSGHSLQFEEVP